MLSLDFVACTFQLAKMVSCVQQCHVNKSPFPRAILNGENIYLLTGFRFQVVVFPRGRLSWVGFTSPTDLDQGNTLLVSTTLKFVETARLDGKLSVKAMNALQGPCLAFKSDAFVAASAELHFENCHNIVKADVDDDEEEEEEEDDYGGGGDDGLWDFDLMQTSTLDAEAAEVDGGAMNVNGSLMVMGTLIIRDCRTDGNGGSLGSIVVAFLQELMMDGPQKVDLWVCYVELWDAFRCYKIDC